MEKKDPASKVKVKNSENATIEEMDQMLEEDALVLLNMKKDITVSHNEELLKLKLSVLAVKKEYDLLHVENEFKERKLQAVRDKEMALSGVDEAAKTTNASAEEHAQDLNNQSATVLDDYAAEQRTIKMLMLMIKRLEKEINQCRVDTAKATVTVAQAKHDVGVSEGNLSSNRQELLEQETQLEKLNATLKTRKENRDEKMNMLHTMSVDGENSMARIQHSINEDTRRLESANRQRLQFTQTARSNASRRTRGTVDEDEFADLIDPNIKSKSLNLNQIKDMVQRYLTQEARMERLKLLDIELKASIVAQQERKREFSEHLSHTLFRIQQLASSRQIYQEVDIKDSALAMTSKECDESKERDFRLRLNIASLRQTVPRLLTKVTKEDQAIPTETQLPDAVLKLDDELTKLIKIIGTALMKDATPEDLAVMASGSPGGVSSEFSRMQKLPGYSRLQRQLFFNLMTAQPDITQRNIRVERLKTKKQPASFAGPAGQYGDTEFAGKELPKQVSDPDMPTEDALGRETIKNISQLIYDRDHGKPVITAKPEKTSLFG